MRQQHAYRRRETDAFPTACKRSKRVLETAPQSINAAQRSLDRLRGRLTQLCTFDNALKGVGATSLGQRTLEEIYLRNVVGSVRRACDYTPAFLPLRVGDEARWVGVRQAVDADGLPPIEVYQVGTNYFVKDGHHRVTVFKHSCFKVVEAYVTEVHPGARNEVWGCHRRSLHHPRCPAGL